ncbi:MAG TPA: 5'-nucleotidase C-terminal domain-containing protein [Thermoanaerobaculia bacterium]|nr:5'-nucleotidase C-terminal domain-containing protein [Thermoanaerobaculia bacterium]
MRRILFLLLLAAPLRAQTVTLLHFSDYHSHALPYYTGVGENQGGIARAIGYLKQQKRAGAIVLSGGDMVNKGAPAWSDKYQCAEWPWFNGIVDAMSFGNHDADYGLEALENCRAQLTYPVLNADNTLVRANGKTIGIFAVAGSDFPRLVKEPRLHFDDPIAAARKQVRELREVWHVDAVVMIGHEHNADDFKLAQAVPGIDLIFGSHSHIEHPLQKIPNTNTWFIAPAQYLTSIARAELTFRDGGVDAIGALVPVDAHMKEDARIAQRVKSMQRALERDPQYAEQFTRIASLSQPLSLEALAARSLEAVRRAVNADVALSTVSSYRQPLPAGPLTDETLRAAMPYDNEIVVATINGAKLQELLTAIEARRGSDSFAYVAKPDTIDASRDYRVATTDYAAGVYGLTGAEKTGKRVREEFRKSL